MRHNRLLAALGLAVMLVTAGCTGLLGTTNAMGSNAQAGTADTTIEVTADGQVEAEPDQAIVRVAVETTADDAATARQTLAENVSRMRTALSELGVPDDRIRTLHYDIREERRHERPKSTSGEPTNEEPTYRAVHAFEVTVNDLDRTGTVIDTAVENGATRVDGVEFTLAPETRAELHNEALAAAMESARGQADTLAASANRTVTDVDTIRTGDTNYRPYRVEAQAMSADGAASTSIDAGPVTVTAQVQVIYNATSQ